VGADGWLLVDSAGDGFDGGIRLINSDGSEAEISGNGTRCAAAFLIHHGLKGNDVRVMTGAGIKHLRLLSRDGLLFQFKMNMGQPEVREQNFALPLAGGKRDVDRVGGQSAVRCRSTISVRLAHLGAESKASISQRTGSAFSARLTSTRSMSAL
jgi:diaminopimelate epimerase